MPDCGSSSCSYAPNRRGMRVASSCTCDRCPICGAYIRPTRREHHEWCRQPEWIPEHHRPAEGP